MTDSLLLDAAGPPFEVLQDGGRSQFFIVCDHAGRELPPALGSLGLSADELSSHIAWDIGAGAVARQLAATLDAELVVQRYSRLVIDCNRPLTAPDSIAVKSGGIPIPGNQGITPAQAEERAKSVFWPYHLQIRSRLDRREKQGQRSILIAMHSFTPELFGSARRWHAGVLYNRDTRFAHALLELLRLEPELVVGDNEPYQGSELTDFSIVEHGERRGNLQVEIEIRQDLLSTEAGVALWSARFARLLEAASRTFHL